MMCRDNLLALVDALESLRHKNTLPCLEISDRMWKVEYWRYDQIRVWEWRGGNFEDKYMTLTVAAIEPTMEADDYMFVCMKKKIINTYKR